MRLPESPARRFLAAAVLATSLAASGCASSSSSSEGDSGAAASNFARSGAYIGLYGIKSYEQFDTNNGKVSAGDSDGGAGLKVGYRITPRIAVEALAEGVKGFGLDDGTATSDLDLLQFGVTGKYYLATSRLQPYLLVGGGAARADTNEEDFKHNGGYFRGGVGMDVYITANFAVFGEANYNRMVGGVSDLHHIDLQLGVMFRF
jgi:opacity protein-like surface antigen